MSGKPNVDRKTERRQATIGEIVVAAWALSREHGLGNFSMRELGAEVGMRAQSLYGYFSSKHEIFDAMFCEGNRALIAHIRDGGGHDDRDDDPREAIIAAGRRFFSFCTRDPVRYQLLFQRTIPGFEPSPESYAVARQAYDVAVGPVRALGLTDSEVDLFVAVLAGLVAQQISNEPGGDRWEQLLEPALAMVLHEYAPEPASVSSTSSRTTPSTTPIMRSTP
jgi:AcrR family transcriptional regulator